MSRSSRAYPPVGDDFFAPVTEGFRLACCDCGLVHNIDFRINDEGEIEVRFERNNRATAARRREMDKADGKALP